MPKNHSERAPARRPTPFSDLNAVLAVLLDGVRERLGDNFVGAYLQGSFAVGDADQHSDCDFIVVVRRDLTADEVSALDAMHTAIHELPYEPWRHRLEGSYVPAAILRRWSAEPRDPPGEPRGPDWADPGLSGLPARAYPFRYLDHGYKTLARSEHDNTQVVRWSLREKGIVLAGPNPRELVDPVSPEALRAEVRETMDRALTANLEPMSMAAWQAFWVGLFCRILHTLATGRVASKKAGAVWAIAHLDPAWRGLVERAQAIRDGERDVAMAPADPDDVAATRAFALYARDYADREERNRAILARAMASKQHGAPGQQHGRPGGANSRGPARSGYLLPPSRPGGRGRRG